MFPVEQTLKEYAAGQPVRFHMPGHKGDLALLCAAYDVTELPFCDNLAAPLGLLRQAQNQAARGYGARATYFMTGGGTSALHAMLLTLPEGSRVLVQRDCHRSVLSGLALSGLTPRYLLPERTDAGYGVVTPALLKNALDTHPDAAAVILTSPTYYGECADLTALSRAAGSPLFVDAAHGAHLHYFDGMQSLAGVALAAMSAHKTLCAPNQSAYLHVGPDCPAHIAECVSACVQLVQTTSPSYPMLAALDAAYRRPEGWRETARRVSALYAALEEGYRPPAQTDRRDPARICIDVTGRGYTGFEADACLRLQNIYMEMADTRRIVGIASPSCPADWYERLADTLNALPQREGPRLLPPPVMSPAEPVMTPRRAMRAPGEWLPLANCAGRICARAAGAYPPGVPLALPGERIDTACVDGLIRCAAEGGVFGLDREENGGLLLECVAE